MGLAIPLETLVKTPNRNKILVGFGVAQEETRIPITKTGADKEIKHNPLALIFLPGMTTPWISW